jgi:Protein of unknown function (DUF2723)
LIHPSQDISHVPRDGRIRVAAWIAAALAVATRVPFAARRLWDHDSIQFALGVEKYDLAAHHPHPPGYPLYIAILKVLNAAGIDSLHGMVALSILAAALGAGLIVPLVARLTALRYARRPGELANAGRPAGASLPPAVAVASPAVASQAVAVASPADRDDAALAAGLFAAALYIFNPLLWFYGELPLVYAVEGGMTVALAWAALRMADSRAALLTGCVAFALAGGVRPSTLVLLLPLFLFGIVRAWRRGAAWTTLLIGALLATAAGLAWLLPLLAAAGGYAGYQRINREHFAALLPYTSILYGAGTKALVHNLTIMTKWFLQGLFPAAVALAGVGLLGLATRTARDRRDCRDGAHRPDGRKAARRFHPAILFLAVWVLPPVVFFALFHITKAGYTLVYLPGLLVAASLVAVPLLTATRVPVRTATAVLLAAAAGAALFLFGVDRRPDQSRALAVVRNEFNRGAIAAYQRDLDQLLAVLRAYPPDTTVLATVELSGTGAAGPESFLYPWQRHLQWYLPQYEVLHLVPEDRLAFVTRGHHPFRREPSPTLVLPPGTTRLAIVLAGPTGDRFPLGAPLQAIGTTFDLVIVPVATPLHLGPFTFVPAL